MSSVPLAPPRINRNPEGLLGFFGIKNGGHNPEEFAPQLSASVELFDWYLETNRRYVRTGVNLTALGFQAFYTVPIGEWWYVSNASLLSGTLGAGQTLEAIVAMQDASATRQLGLSEMPGSRTVGAVFATAAGGFWLSPGDQLGVYTVQLAAGPIVSPILTVAYTPLAT